MYGRSPCTVKIVSLELVSIVSVWNIGDGGVCVTMIE